VGAGGDPQQQRPWPPTSSPSEHEAILDPPCLGPERKQQAEVAFLTAALPTRPGACPEIFNRLLGCSRARPLPAPAAPLPSTAEAGCTHFICCSIRVATPCVFQLYKLFIPSEVFCLGKALCFIFCVTHLIRKEGKQVSFKVFRWKTHMSRCHNSLPHYKEIKFKKADELLTMEATTLSSGAVLFALQRCHHWGSLIA